MDNPLIRRLFFVLVLVAVAISSACGGGGDDDDNGDDTVTGDDTGTDDSTDDDTGIDIVPTTLDITLVPVLNSTTQKWELALGPGEPHEIRNDLNVAPTREGSGERLSMTYFMTISDLHQTDEEAPTRLTYFDSAEILMGMFNAAFRPQEDLAAHQLNAIIRTADRIELDYGRNFDFAISLGDNTDNGQLNEMTQTIDILDAGGLLSGKPGIVRVDSGALNINDQTGLDEGERDFGIQEKDSEGHDISAFNRPGYPNSNADFATDGLLTAEGRPLPWYTVIGNHDVLNTGNFDPTSGLTFFSVEDYTSDLAHYGYIPGLGATVQGWRDDPDDPIFLDGGIFGLEFDWRMMFQALDAVGLIPQDITVDIDSRFDLPTLQHDTPLDPSDDGVEIVGDNGREFMGHDALIKLVNSQGHGFADNNGDLVVDSRDGGYYRVEWKDFAPNSVMPLRLLALDTADKPVLADGGIGDKEFQWLQDQLDAAVADEVLVIVASHHSAGDTLAGGSKLEAMLTGCPNVILHLVGHGHTNEIIPHPAPQGSPSPGYWEVQTPSIIEFPQQSRIVEIVDNRDGTGSVFLTLYDHWQTLGDDPDILSGLGRELAFEDVVRLGYTGTAPLGGMGTPGDRNRELLFAMPAQIADRLAQIDSEEPITSVDVLGHLYQ